MKYSCFREKFSCILSDSRHGTHIHAINVMNLFVFFFSRLFPWNSIRFHQTNSKWNTTNILWKLRDAEQIPAAMCDIFNGSYFCAKKWSNEEPAREGERESNSHLMKEYIHRLISRRNEIPIFSTLLLQTFIPFEYRNCCCFDKFLVLFWCD